MASRFLFVMDYVACALSTLANISERRIERLVNPSLSDGLPAFLTTRGGLHSGFMLAQYTAAALARKISRWHIQHQLIELPHRPILKTSIQWGRLPVAKHA